MANERRKRRGRGEHSIYQRADGLWCASVSNGYAGDGRRKRRTFYGATKKDVQDKLQKATKEGVNFDPTTMTIADYLERWFSDAKQTVAPGTAKRYEEIYRLHVVPYIGHVRLAKLVPLHVVQMFAEQEKAGMTPRNRQLAGVVLQRACRDAVRLKLIPFNPCLGVAKPRVPKPEMTVWDAAQTIRFLRATEEDRLHALYVTAVTAGMRQGELFGLHWPDIDFASESLVVQRSIEELDGKLRIKEPKTAAGRRRIPLPKIAVTALHEHRKRMLAEGNAGGPVFCDTRGSYLRKGNVLRRSYRPAVKRAGVPEIRFHDLRHSCATLLLMSGENPKVVAERLGHARVEVTLNTYSHVLPTMQTGAAEKLDRLLG